MSTYRWYYFRGALPGRYDTLWTVLRLFIYSEDKRGVNWKFQKNISALLLFSLCYELTSKKVFMCDFTEFFKASMLYPPSRIEIIGVLFEYSIM